MVIEGGSLMEILVCIKQVPGTSKVKVDEKTGVLKRDGVASKINPYDLYALETALRIKAKVGGRVSVISMGPPQAELVIKEAYMMGADEGVLLSDRRFAGADVLATSYTISQGIKKAGNFDLILCGKQTTDGDTAQVGPEIAEYLKVPHVANVKNIIDIKESSIILEADLTNVLEKLEIKYPCLLTIEKDIFEPRLPSYKKKLETKNREIRSYCLDDLEDIDEKMYGLSGSPTQVERIFPPEVNLAKEIWQGTSEDICDKLFEKLKDMRYV
jgi:electron transfer flavoprotein beta subunit